LRPAAPGRAGKPLNPFDTASPRKAGNLEFALITFLNGLGYGFCCSCCPRASLIYSMMGVPNFAHASFYMLGAYVAYALAGVLGFWWALLLAPLIVGVAGALVEHYGLRIVHATGMCRNCCSPSACPIWWWNWCNWSGGARRALPHPARTGWHAVHAVFHRLPGLSRLHAAGGGLMLLACGCCCAIPASDC
jgi:hypothetical protein